MHYGLEGYVGPYDFSVIVQQSVRQVQLPQKLLLYLTVLRSEADQLIHDNGLVVKIQRQGYGKIDDHERPQKRPRPEVQHKHPHVHAGENHAQIDAALNIGLDPAL